jgi:subtilisin-like proprotein convertase family protein
MSFQKLIMALLVFAAGEAGLQGQFAQTNSFDGVNMSIPDGDLDGVQDVRNVTSDITQITSVRVRLKISGDFNGDLYVYLRHDDGISSHICVLLNRPGRSTTNNFGYADYGVDVALDDTAANDIHTYQQVVKPAPDTPLTGTWQPDARFVDPLIVTADFPRSAFLNEFAGMNATGEWTLFLADVDEGGTNYLDSWGIEITGAVAPSITWTNPPAIVYGTSLGPDQLNATANVPGTFVYNPPAGTVLAGGNNQPISVTFQPDDTNSYAVASASVALTVLPAPLTVGADNQSRIYGATNPAFTVTYSGFVNGDSVTNSDLEGAPLLATPATTTSPVGSYEITNGVGNLTSADYTLTFTNGTLNIMAAPITVIADNLSRTYGATNPPLTGSVSGLQNGDLITAVFQTTTDTNSPVGTYPITSAIQDPGGALGNYIVSYANGTLDVVPALLGVTADNQSRIYGATNPVLTATYGGFVNGESLTNSDVAGAPSLETATDTTSPVGMYDITNSLGSLTSTNYTFTFTNGTLTVAAAAITVSADNQSRVYGATNPPLTGSVAGLQNGDLITAVFQTTADTNSPVGTYPITPILQDPGGLLGNYLVSYVNGTLGVGPAMLGVMAANQSRIYGTTNPVLTATYSGFVNGESLTNSDVMGAPQLDTEADTNSPVGTYDITIGMGSLTSTNYAFNFTNGTLTVATAAITVTADNQSRTYGATNPPLTASYTGFINGDTAAVITGQPSLSVGANTSSPAGSYPITVHTGTLIATTNYAFIFVNGSLNVIPASLTVSADNQSRTYGATNPVLTATYGGFVNGESLTNSDVAGASSLETAADTTSPVGMYDITNSLGSLTSTNYTFTFTNGTLTVAAAAITVSADNQSRVYGATNPPLTGSVAGLQNGDLITAVFQTTADTNSPVGIYPITPTLQDSDGVLGNYIVSYVDGILNITQAVSEITLVSSVNPALPGSSVTFSANVSTLISESGTPSGSVQFIVDGADYQVPVNLAGGGIASLTTATLPVGGHTVSAMYSGDADFLGAAAMLQPVQVIDTPPVAGADVIYRLPTLVATIPVSALLANDSAADGQPVIFSSVSATSAVGGTVSQSGEWVFYTPPAGFTNADSFTYVVSDDLGEFATGTVAVNVLTNRGTTATLNLLSLGNGTYQIVLYGIPWGNYTVQYTTSLAKPNWQPIATSTADFQGMIGLVDTESQVNQTGFYRAICNSNGPASLPVNLAPDTSPVSSLFSLVGLNSSANPALPGSSVTFSVKIAALAPISEPPSGSVQFMVDDAAYGTPVAFVNGNASLTTANLPAGEHTVSAAYSGDGSVAFLKQIINTPPVANNESIQLNPLNTGIKFPFGGLNCSDPDGNPLKLEIGTSTAEGGTLNFVQGWIFYTPPIGFSGVDSFPYTVQDTFGATASATVEIDPGVGIGDDQSANLSVVNLSNDTYLVTFSGIPWLTYTIQYTESLTQPDWHTITTMTADSKGFFEYVDTLPQGTPSRYYRSISQSAAVTASPFRLASWTNFIAHTNGQTMNMWSEETLPPGWPNTPPLLAWNTNCILYGLDGFTGISQCNEFQGAPGQVPVTLLTRRHGYLRGHSIGPNGLETNRAGQRVWFCTADNKVVQMTVAALYVRFEINSMADNDYSIVEFTQDVPDDIRPVSVISPANMQIYYSDTPDLPYLFLATEQTGHCEANVPPFIYDVFEGGDSGSPRMIPSPDNKLIMFAGTSTTGFTPQMQADIDTLSVYMGLNPANYQLHWYDLSPWAP